MDKNAIKKYAIWARRELISRVSQRAALYEITADGYGDKNAPSVHGRIMSADEKKQRCALITQIEEKGYEQVMEEIAYTWFNRFSALRFMEVNGYLPTHIRVFTDDDNNFKPQILTEAINMELDGLDMQIIYNLKNANDDDALFKYMIITQCNALYSILPGMFQRISDYTELLFPDNLLREGSVIEQMIALIPQEDWTDQVQIIGWLYQYYNTEPKDKVFANLKKNIKISKENIPAATQLFTPDWIVRYMVENSLGRLWLEGHPNDDLKTEWKYYLDEAEQEPEVQVELAELRKEYAALKPEDILAIDPCQGSGHILAYMFDVLVQIYEVYGYSAREAASCIIEHNIWGIDIDERAAQLAYFSVMMKARQYDRRFFSRRLQPHIYAIKESNKLDPHCIEYFIGDNKELKISIDTLMKDLYDAKEYGSLLHAHKVDFNLIDKRFKEIQTEAELSIYSAQIEENLYPLLQVAKTLSQQYHVVVTNPPYMGNGSMSLKLSKYVKKHYVNSRRDLFAAFIERCKSFTLKEGLFALITQQSWMFINSYESLRSNILNTSLIMNMAQLGPRAFEEIGGEVVQTTAFVVCNTTIDKYLAKYVRLVSYENERLKETHFLASKKNASSRDLFISTQSDFDLIPKSPVAYWLNHSTMQDFKDNMSVEDKYFSCYGLLTGHDEGFIFDWYEVAYSDISFNSVSVDSFNQSGKKYAPLAKGGLYRKWYGNRNLIVRYDLQGISGMSKYPKYASNGQSRYFSEGITWAEVCMGKLSLRYMPIGNIFSLKGPCLFAKTKDDLLRLLGYLNTDVVRYFVQILNPTISCGTGVVNRLPIKGIDRINPEIVAENIRIAKEDWDSFETSFDFQRHPLLHGNLISESFCRWSNSCESRYQIVENNEKELNRIFFEEYGLSNDLTYAEISSDITIEKSDRTRDIKSLISYSVGCMFGRYSLDLPGLIYAGGEWDKSKYESFIPDEDGIIPISDDDYFEDDIVGNFIRFIEIAFGKETLEENLNYIASSIESKGNSSREIIRNYFINDFYSDHLKTYQKKPIYWLFDSGKKNGFKCLIYLHRYQQDTIARIRTDYVHEQQSRYRTETEDIERRLLISDTKERVKLNKSLEIIKAKGNELRIYEEKIHHLADQMIKINIDNGIKYNYSLFKDVLSKIK